MQSCLAGQWEDLGKYCPCSCRPGINYIPKSTGAGKWETTKLSRIHSTAQQNQNQTKPKGTENLEVRVCFFLHPVPVATALSESKQAFKSYL